MTHSQPEPETQAAAADSAGRELRVGQTLLFVPTDQRWRKPSEVTITKIGRKWAYLGQRLRVDMTTMCMDGGGFSSPGRCYLSASDYESEKAADEIWSLLRRRLPWGKPPGVSAAAIRQAAALLGVEIEGLTP